MRRNLTKSELEKAYSLQLERRAHDVQIDEVAFQQEALRSEIKQQEVEAEEKLATVSRAISRQNHGYQLELNQLNDQLRALKARTSS